MNFFSIFFRIFLPGSSTNGIRDKFFFFSFLASLSLFWIEIMLDRGFLIFWFFLLFFSEYSCPGWVWTEFGTKIFLSLSQPILARNNTRKRFFNFFCYFSRNFLAWVDCERNSGLNFFSPFLGLSHPVLVRNNVGKMFFNFLNYFAIFFAIFFPGPSMNGIRD